MRKIYIFIAFVVVLVLAGLTAVIGFYGGRINSQPPTNNSTVNSGKRLNLTKLELAKTDVEQAKGLMYRKELCQTCGMLFIFKQDQRLSFWMANTYVSLDMVFIDQNGRVTNIETGTTPLRQSPTYNSDGLARYVLEVPAGFASNNGLNTGDQLDLQHLLETGQSYDNSFTGQTAS
jgi:uncharacterized protein